MPSVFVRRLVPIAIAASVLTMTPASTALAGTALAAPPPGAWSTELPEASRPATLLGITAPTRTTAWAVGSEAGVTAPLILRWNGRTWSRDTVPAGTAPELVDVSARGPANAWAVGQSANAGDAQALRWNGRVWKTVPYPLAQALGVSVDSRGTAWSVGCSADQSDCPVLQYRAGDWVRHSPAPGTPLLSIAARTPRDVWAGGIGHPGDDVPLYRYDGRTWERIPFASQWPHMILQILPVSAQDVWVYTMPFDPLFSGPRLMHWDGSTWTEHVPPRPATQQVGASAADPGFLGRIASDGRGGVWLQNNMSAYYLHFDGTTWTNVPRSLPFQGIPVVYGMAQIPGTRSILAAGYGGEALVIERFR